MEIENQIELTNTSKILVQDLNKKMNKLKHTQIIIVLINTKSKVQSSIPSINNLMIMELQEVGHF
jgi:hypothetical protein